MLISPAWAHGLARADTSGGGIALLIILTVVIVLFLGYLGQKKWRRRKLIPRSDGGGE
jgi:hypothetical protein